VDRLTNAFRPGDADKYPWLAIQASEEIPPVIGRFNRNRKCPSCGYVNQTEFFSYPHIYVLEVTCFKCGEVRYEWRPNAPETIVNKFTRSKERPLLDLWEVFVASPWRAIGRLLVW
jgi:phage FluMu protein Com